MISLFFEILFPISSPWTQWHQPRRITIILYTYLSTFCYQSIFRRPTFWPSEFTFPTFFSYFVLLWKNIFTATAHLVLLATGKIAIHAELTGCVQAHILCWKREAENSSRPQQQCNAILKPRWSLIETLRPTFLKTFLLGRSDECCFPNLNRPIHNFLFQPLQDLLFARSGLLLQTMTIEDEGSS